MTKRLRAWVVAPAITCVKKWGTKRFGRVARRRALFTKVVMTFVTKGDRLGCDIHYSTASASVQQALYMSTRNRKETNIQVPISTILISQPINK